MSRPVRSPTRDPGPTQITIADADHADAAGRCHGSTTRVPAAPARGTAAPDIAASRRSGQRTASGPPGQPAATAAPVSPMRRGTARAPWVAGRTSRPPAASRSPGGQHLAGGTATRGRPAAGGRTARLANRRDRHRPDRSQGRPGQGGQPAATWQAAAAGPPVDPHPGGQPARQRRPASSPASRPARTIARLASAGRTRHGGHGNRAGWQRRRRPDQQALTSSAAPAGGEPASQPGWPPGGGPGYPAQPSHPRPSIRTAAAG